MAKDKSPPGASYGTRLSNKKARFNYEILEKLETGISLKGTEVKSLRLGEASLAEAFARIERGEVYLHNFQILPYKQGGHWNHDPKRPKKLLLHKREIKKLSGKVQIKGLTLVPLELYFNKDGRAKVEIALARGKTHHDKRASERKKEDRKEIAQVRRRGGL